MSLVLIVYLIGILPSLGKVFGVILTISVFLGIVGACSAPIWLEDYAESIIKFAKKAFHLLFLK